MQAAAAPGGLSAAAAPGGTTHVVLLQLAPNYWLTANCKMPVAIAHAHGRDQGPAGPLSRLDGAFYWSLCSWRVVHGRGTGASGVHAPPKSHGQARALGHESCSLLVAAGLRERETGIHSDPPGGVKGFGAVVGGSRRIPSGVSTPTTCRSIPGHARPSMTQDVYMGRKAVAPGLLLLSRKHLVTGRLVYRASRRRQRMGINGFGGPP